MCKTELSFLMKLKRTLSTFINHYTYILSNNISRYIYFLVVVENKINKINNYISYFYILLTSASASPIPGYSNHTVCHWTQLFSSGNHCIPYPGYQPLPPWWCPNRDRKIPEPNTGKNNYDKYTFKFDNELFRATGCNLVFEFDCLFDKLIHPVTSHCWEKASFSI